MVKRLQSFYYDRQGRPLLLCQWMKLLGDESYRVVARTTLGEGQLLVSTVWIGMSIVGCRGTFETMVFRADGPGEDRELHDTEDEALAAHREIVSRLMDQEGWTKDPLA